MCNKKTIEQLLYTD